MEGKTTKKLMTFPFPHNCTLPGQKASFCWKTLEEFRSEHNNKPIGVRFRNKRTELNAIIPEEYHNHNLVRLNKYWSSVLNGNPELGWPGIDESLHEAVTAKKNEAFQLWCEFNIYQRINHSPRINKVIEELNNALADCDNDDKWNPNVSDFEVTDGKLRMKLPSNQSPINEASNISFIRRFIKLNPNAENEYKDAVSEALKETKINAKTGNYWNPDISNIIAEIPLSELPDPLEDLTTYTEVDPNNRYSITSTIATFTGLTRNEDAYVYDDKGLNHFSSDVDHLLDATITAAQNKGHVVAWLLANIIDDGNQIINNDTCIGIFLRKTSSGSQDIVLAENISATPIFDISNYTLNVTDYLRVKRDESIGSFGQLSCDIYSDADRTILTDTLTLSLRAKNDFRYVYILNSINDGNVEIISGSIANLDLQEIVGIPIFRRRIEGHT